MLDSEHEYFREGQVFHGFVPLIMGTRLEVLMAGVEEGLCGKLWESMCAVAERLQSLMNRFDPGSEVSRINSAGEAILSPEMSGIISICEHFRKSTGGLFDIGRGTIDWENAFDEGHSCISLHGGNLDFGGIGKGYLLKEYRKMLLDAGVATAYIDFGGSSIMALGHHPYGNCWKVGVMDPYSGAKIREIELVDMSMSTSGNQPGYEGHITDPRNGLPVTGRRLVTILSPDPLTAEIASTAAMIADEEDIAFIKENNEIAEISGLSSTSYGK